MPKQKRSKSAKNAQDKDFTTLYTKLLNIEDCAANIQTLNNLLIPYAHENSAEVSLISGLIDTELEQIFKIILKS